MRSSKTNPFPLHNRPLVHAITNSITNELVANSLLAIGAKPIMAEDHRELNCVIQSADGVLINLGQMSSKKEGIIQEAARLAHHYKKPLVIDAVGVTQLTNRMTLIKDLLLVEPTVVKGNTSEIRALLGLNSQAVGVDACKSDQSQSALRALASAMKAYSLSCPNTIILATGRRDVLAGEGKVWWMDNGVDHLDCITGTGDVVGALITALLADGRRGIEACLQAVTYFNLCGEQAHAIHPEALASFRQEVLDQLTLLSKDEAWVIKAKVWRSTL